MGEFSKKNYYDFLNLLNYEVLLNFQPLIHPKMPFFDNQSHCSR